MKNRIIIFPGKMSDVFFLNEIDYIREFFDSIYVFTYKGDIQQYNRIAKEKNIEYEVIKDISWNSIFQIVKEFFRGKNKEIFYELHKVLKKEGNIKTKIKRIGYLLYYINYAFNVEKAYRKINSDNYNAILYSFWLSRGAYACAYLKDKYRIKKCIARAHGFDLYDERNSINYIPFRRLICKNIDKLCFVSEHGYRYFQKKYKCNIEKLCIYRLGSSNFNGLKKQIKNKNFVSVVSCSYIIPVKRLDLIIDILSRLTIPFKWIHIGEGNLQKEIQEYAERKLKKENFLFLGSIENQFILNTYMEEDVDYLINMSDSEGLPVSMMEAFSVGIPVISRNVGGVSEIVSNDCGLLLEKDFEFEFITQKVEEILSARLSNISLYCKMSEAALIKWKQKFDAEKNYNKFTEMLSGL